jgi:hypothetical protein
MINVISLSKVKKRSEEVIEKYKGVTTLEKIDFTIDVFSDQDLSNLGECYVYPESAPEN